MPKPRVLSGPEVLKILREFGFQKLAQRGSHVKVRRVLEDGQTRSSVPNHDEIDRGTLHAIYRQASRFIPEPELRARFFHGVSSVWSMDPTSIMP
jgi:predicted RNA binding protein YcfA (HicA-like mRNA interferase family)